MSSFFSPAPRLFPPSSLKQFNLYCLDTASLSCLLWQTFLATAASESLSHVSVQIFSAEGSQLLLYPKLSEDESSNSGNTGNPWQRKCPVRGSLLTGLFLERPLVHISEGRFSCKPSSYQVMLPLCQQKSQALTRHCLVCEIR